MTPLPSVAEAADRAGISQRGAASLVSDTLQDIGRITENDASQVVDKNKIHRERTRNRTRKVQAAEQGTIRAIFFDGKKIPPWKKLVVAFRKHINPKRKSIIRSWKSQDLSDIKGN